MRRFLPIILTIGLCATSAIAMWSGTAEAIPVTPVLAYVKPVGGVPTVFTAAADGTNAVARVGHATSVAVSPDAAHLAYFSDSGHVSVSSITGSGRVAVFNTTSFAGLSWAPDATRLVVAQASGLSIVDTVTRAVTAIPNTAGVQHPQWSPDGTLIAGAKGTSQVIVQPNGASRTVRSNRATGPWSVDGKYMLTHEFFGNDLFADEVMTNNTHLMSFLGSYASLGEAWGPISGTTFTFYESVDASGSQLGGGIQLVRHTIDTSVANDFGTDQPIADDATSPSLGGLTATDLNGAPGPVTGLTTALPPSFIDLSWTPPVSTPDFAGVEIRYALGGIPPATVTDGLPGGRVLGNSKRLGPFDTQQQVSYSVFTRDWAGHVGPPVSDTQTTSPMAASTLRAVVTPIHIAKGATATITLVQRQVFDQLPVPDAPISISVRTLGTNGPFVTIGSVRTSLAGVAVIHQTPSIGREYRFVSAGTGLASGATTTAKIVMIPGASLTAPRLKGRARSNVTLTLRTSPGLKNVTTRLQRLSTTWIDAGPHNTNPAGVVTYTVRFPARGASTKVRVLIPASVGYGATVSNVLTLTGT